MTNSRTFDPAGAHRLDRPDRAVHLPQAAIASLVAPTPGIALAEIGVGTGYSLFPVIDAVKGDGTFYALDSQQAMLDELAQRLSGYAHAASVRPVLTPEDSVALPALSVDAVLIVSTYHELPDRARYCLDIHRVLRPGGRLIAIDWKPLAEGAERVAGPPADHRVPAAQAHAEIRQAGFALIEEQDAFPLLWAIVARKGG